MPSMKAALLTFVLMWPCLDSLIIPNAIASNMVLQRAPLAPRLWGFANASETITITLDGISHLAKPDVSGNWVLDLPKQEASTGKTISITSTSGAAVTLSNIAFGDVYLCSGQSNMEFSTNDAFNASEEIQDSVNYPDLRFYTIKDTAANSPKLDGVSKANYAWGVSSPASFVPAGGGGFSYFSATCYFFGRDLYKALGGKVPIGLVASDWGGQRVECFSSPDAIADTTCGGTKNASISDGHTTRESSWHYPIEEEDSKYATSQRHEGFGSTNGPVPNPSTSQLWYGQIYPFLNMRLTGATWYQGEANSKDPEGYACRFPAMITDWRKKFQLPDLSFFFVQLAAYSEDYSNIRAAQMAALKLPKTGYAAAIDLGDPSSPRGSIHPRRKQEVGRRLSLACQKVQYGMDVVSTGPELGTYKIDGQSITLTFSQATSKGLHQAGTGACKACCAQSPLEVQVLPAYTWEWQRTGPLTVSGNTVTAQVNMTKNQKIGGFRFDWEGYPQCALYNGLGGPDDHIAIAAAPFKPFSTKPLPVPYSPSGAVIPSTSAGSFEFSGGASLTGGPKDNSTSGAASLRSGGPGGVSTIRVGSPSGIIGKGHRLDGISMSFRYLAGYTPPANTTKVASTLRVVVLDLETSSVLKTLPPTGPLGNYSWDHFTGYSPRVPIKATGLDISNDKPVVIALQITNNQRNIQIPVDDMASGFELQVTWTDSMAHDFMV